MLTDDFTGAQNPNLAKELSDLHWKISPDWGEIFRNYGGYDNPRLGLPLLELAVATAPMIFPMQQNRVETPGKPDVFFQHASG